jgi:hypothetical protein
MCCRLFSWVLVVIILLLPAHLGFASEEFLPQPDHVVVAIFENHSFNQIMDSTQAPYFQKLAREGALFINSYAVAHPSEPNYFALFSGSTQGVHDDRDHTFNAPTLADALATAHKRFIGYIETGSPRHHNPWESFNSSHATERNLNEFPSDFAQLPTVSFVVPNLDHDMHDGSIRDGDAWLRRHLESYANWSKTHNSLLIVTFDEDNDVAGNRILTIFYGACVRPGRYVMYITHYSVLSTLLAMYGLPRFAEAATTLPIRAIWDKQVMCHS